MKQNCPKCNHINDSSMLSFCSKCGYFLSDSPATNQSSNPPSNYKPTIQQSSRPPGNYAYRSPFKKNRLQKKDKNKVPLPYRIIGSIFIAMYMGFSAGHLAWGIIVLIVAFVILGMIHADD